MGGLVTRDTQFAAAVRGLIWRAEHAWSMDAGAPMYFGWVTPEIEMVSLGRDYFTNSKSLKVDLYQATFTVGTPVETLNRRLILRNDPPPLQIYHTVTPGALTDRITGFNVESTGPVRVDRRGDTQPFVHDPLTSYVLAITNELAGAEPYSFSLDFRLKFPGEGE
jgi:hypothetical protein